MVKKVARVLVGASFGGICGWCANGENIEIPIVFSIIGFIAFIVYQSCE